MLNIIETVKFLVVAIINEVALNEIKTLFKKDSLENNCKKLDLVFYWDLETANVRFENVSKDYICMYPRVLQEIDSIINKYSYVPSNKTNWQKTVKEIINSYSL